MAFAPENAVSQIDWKVKGRKYLKISSSGICIDYCPTSSLSLRLLLGLVAAIVEIVVVVVVEVAAAALAESLLTSVEEMEKLVQTFLWNPFLNLQSRLLLKNSCPKQ